MSTDQVVDDTVTTRRRRRSRDETRTILLQTATRLATATAMGGGDDGRAINPLAGLRIADVVAQANGLGHNDDRQPMTTGAAYQIWPTQAEFQADLLDHVIMGASAPGWEPVQSRMLGLLAEGAPYERIVGEVFELDFELSAAMPEVYLMYGAVALSPVDQVERAVREPNRVYMAQLSDVLSALLRYGRRRLRPGRAIDDLVWAIEALETGYLLRRRTHPEVPVRPDASRRSALAAAVLAMIDAFTEEDVREHVGDGG
jgi:hypothetical protein